MIPAATSLTLPGRVLITGAGGSVGKVLRTAMVAHRSIQLRTSDLHTSWEYAPGEEAIAGDIRDFGHCLALTRSVDTVIHLAGIPHEATWDDLSAVNINGTFNIFEAARQNRVRRVIFASTHHVVGFHPRDRILDSESPLRPDSRYAVSKACGEAVGRLYADKFGLEVACLRIGVFRERPTDERMLAMWLSARDLVSLVDRILTAPAFHYIVLYGVSANSRRVWRDPVAETMGYHPLDDAEAWAPEILAQDEINDPIARAFQGGRFCSTEFGGNPERID